MCWLLCTNLQNKTNYRRVIPFAGPQKSQREYFVSESLSRLDHGIHVFLNKPENVIRKVYRKKGIQTS